MKVHIFATVRKEELLPAATLIFKTLRTGFPTAEICVYWNGLNACKEENIVHDISAQLNAHWDIVGNTTHHEWVARLIREEQESFWICDTDIIFWDSMEQWGFGSHSLSGRFSPQFRCQFSNAVTRPRLHTCLLRIDPVKVRAEVEAYGKKFPDCYATPRPTIDDLVFPRYMPNLSRLPYFSDTCSLLYNAIGGYRFSENHLNCFDHLGSATLSDLVAPCYPEYRMRETHFAIFENPQLAKGSWKLQDEFYAKHAC